MFSRTFDRHVSRNGESIFRNDEIALGRPKRKGAFVDYLVFDNEVVKAYESRGERVPESVAVGFATLDVGETGKIYAINNVFINNDKRKNGYAEKLLRAILATNPDGDRLRINSILPEAMPFWEKMGVHNLERGKFLENGEITRGSYERGRTRLEDGSGSSGLVFSRREGGDLRADDPGRGARNEQRLDERIQKGAIVRTDAQAKKDAETLREGVQKALRAEGSSAVVPVTAFWIVSLPDDSPVRAVTQAFDRRVATFEIESA